MIHVGSSVGGEGYGNKRGCSCINGLWWFIGPCPVPDQRRLPQLVSKLLPHLVLGKGLSSPHTGGWGGGV